MNIFQKVKEVLLQPSRFFAKIEKEKGIHQALYYYSLLVVIYAALFSILLKIKPGIYFFLFPFPQLAVKNIFLLALLFSIFSILGSFLVSFLLHIWIIIFNGKKKFSDTYKLYVYSTTPKLVFGWIPIINFFVWIYSLVLLIIGTHIMYKVNKLRATLFFVVPLIILFLIFILLFFLLLSFLVIENPTGF